MTISPIGSNWPRRCPKILNIFLLNRLLRMFMPSNIKSTSNDIQ
ncbi:hypothetical protein LINPERPRIM_LOCUS2993 [Linum perenne]